MRVATVKKAVTTIITCLRVVFAFVVGHLCGPTARTGKDRMQGFAGVSAMGNASSNATDECKARVEPRKCTKF